MGILEDLTALGKDPKDLDQVVDAIRTLSASPEGRAKLLREWEVQAGVSIDTTDFEKFIAA